MDVGVDADPVVDGAVDMSTTFVVHVDESTVIILVKHRNGRRHQRVRPTDSEVNDKGGAHVHGAVEGHGIVDDHVNAHIDRISGTGP